MVVVVVVVVCVCVGGGGGVFSENTFSQSNEKTNNTIANNDGKEI